MACQVPEDHQGHQESLGEMAREGTLVMLDQEESQDQSDQREILGDLALATLDQEDPRVKEGRKAIVGLAAAEETAVRKVNLETKGSQESRVNQDLRVNQA